jgi:hypothetical protein
MKCASLVEREIDKGNQSLTLYIPNAQKREHRRNKPIGCKTKKARA